MQFFRRNSKSGVGARNSFGANDDGRPKKYGDDGDLAGDSRRITLSVMRAGQFAAMMARSRASAVMEVSDLLAGMYISDWDNLSQYWDEEDQDRVEEFLRKFCQMSPQRWNSWIDLYKQEHREGVSEKPWRGKKRAARPPEAALQKSVALEDVLRQAEQIAPHYDRDQERKLPILTNEAILLCIARSYGTEISRNLAASGIDTAKLEQDVLFPRRAPLA
jgi:hypothetical protein